MRGQDCFRRDSWHLFWLEYFRDSRMQKAPRCSANSLSWRVYRRFAMNKTWYEFFAGGGMARLGLGNDWSCLYSNDISEKKAVSYQDNFDEDGCFTVKDIYKIGTQELPGSPDLVWGSFPCQDLSLAGSGIGLSGKRSGTYVPFLNIIRELKKEKRGPELVVLENVTGAITSHAGDDFRRIVSDLVADGFYVGAVVVDAALFVPQSRPRLFIVAARCDQNVVEQFTSSSPSMPWHVPSIQRAIEQLPSSIKSQFVWWNLPLPGERTTRIEEIIEESPNTVPWHTPEETEYLLSLMSEVNLAKVEDAKKSGRISVGTIYKRVRRQGDGTKLQRAEVRFDGLAGCLRTPRGGSSRQILMIVDGSNIRSRLVSPREAARLMGVPDSYILPVRPNEAYQLFGDGVVVPVVSFLEQNLITPLSNEISVLHARAA